jgi:hypothetical protein
MPTHEEKRCPRCEALFICKVGTIAECQCRSVQLSAAQRQYIAEQYDDCLCSICMQAERSAFCIDSFKQRIARLLGR